LENIGAFSTFHSGKSTAFLSSLLGCERMKKEKKNKAKTIKRK
jgi:hypothetical protein